MSALRKYVFAFFLVVTMLPSAVSAQSSASLRADEIPGWVFGYVTDDRKGEPVEGVYVWAYGSEELARRYQKALSGRKSPASVNMGGVIETCTDKAGRYMIPVLRDGALLFFFPGSGKTVVETVRRRYSVNVGKVSSRQAAPERKDSYMASVDTSGVVRPRRAAPVGTRFNFDFNYYFPYRKDCNDVRMIVERNVVDVMTGDTLSSVAPVVLDGKTYHRRQRRLLAKGEVRDSLFEVADRCKVLTDTTFSVKIRDSFDADQWMSRCFMISYRIKVDNGLAQVCLDTLPMMMNRVSRPLQFIECPFSPYDFVPEPYPVSRRPGKRVLTVVRSGTEPLPEVLMGEDYVLKKISVKAAVAPEGEYRADLDRAGIIAREVLSEVRKAVAAKMTEDVRVTMLSEVSQTPAVECRYVFETYRKFVPEEYYGAFDKAADDAELEALYRRAVEESELLDGRMWNVAANRLAALYIERGSPDTTVLAPFVSGTEYGCCDEIVANQVIAMMLCGDFAGAEALSASLPSEYAVLRAVARCKCHMVDFDDPSETETIELIKNSSLRNKVVMDLLLGMDESTVEALSELPQDKASTFYLKAQRLCLMYRCEASRLRSGRFVTEEDPSLLRAGESGISAYEAVVRYLVRCFEIDEGFRTVAARDADINDDALKEAIRCMR